MKHEPIIDPLPLSNFDWQGFCKRILVAAIKAKGISDEDRKFRITTAYEHGHLTAEEAEDFIVLWGLIEA